MDIMPSITDDGGLFAFQGRKDVNWGFAFGFEQDATLGDGRNVIQFGLFVVVIVIVITIHNPITEGPGEKQCIQVVKAGENDY